MRVDDVENVPWPEDVAEQLRAMWSDLSYGSVVQISKILGRSKGSVQKKATRMRLGPRPRRTTRHPHNIELQGTPDAKSNELVATFKLPQRDMSAWPPPAPPTYRRLCNWPDGSPGTVDFSWCARKCWMNQATGLRFPYCQQHTKLAYRILP